MKTKRSICVAIFFLTLLALPVCSQESSPSIAVSRPSMSGLKTKAITAEKMLRIEVAKLNKYVLYDQYDMEEIIQNDSTFLGNCQSKACLIRMGKELGVDYIISGSYDRLGPKIVVFLKLVDVKLEKVIKTATGEFDDQEYELQRMTESVLKEIHGIEMSKAVSDRLDYQNDPITKNSVSKINNSGPRVGYALMTGSVREFAMRDQRQGGLDIFPGISMIGYQFEGQYVGTENFSALFEVVINFNGLEQGQFIPTFNLLNGFRFGKAGWEFAFGPGFGVKKTTYGFFDANSQFGEQGRYYSDKDWTTYATETYSQDPEHQDDFGNFILPDPSKFDESYSLDIKHPDARGAAQLSTHFIFALGRTFRAGALNIPVNLFYSAKRKGGMAGLSVGFNVVKSKTRAGSTSTYR